ncbi:anti-anti-sigma factor [Kitasatospora sp. MAP12-15]|uniref:STAS domain-containing protein n=1 Tax=unclassified Kitasatospora TaxID=2633591 RepID=UPI0024756882|nr:STAS domain-containing protein [Kitasatospora sp. MAP12-44]MDH6115610.1 anti-anti-sigma factor [Kitasatospora sp. MAP12-44]
MSPRPHPARPATEDRSAFPSGESAPTARFAVYVTRVAAERVLAEVVGEVDHDGADELRRALAIATRDTATVLELDLTGMSFCDCAGLSALLRTREDAAAAGCVALVTAMTPQLCRLLDITGTRDVLTGSLSAAEAPT